MNTNKQRRKGSYFLGRKLQVRLLIRLTLYWVLYHAIVWHVLLVISILSSDGAPQPFLDRYLAFFQEHSILVLLAVTVFPVLFWDLTKLSHRIAGPFVRLENAFRQMAQGEEVRPIKLRKHDLVPELVAAFNLYLAERSGPASDAAAQLRQTAERDGEQHSEVLETAKA